MQEINALIKNRKKYGGLVLNDFSRDEQGQPVVKMEKEREDGKKRRQYYNLSFISTESLAASRVVTVWQSHQKNGEEVIWKGVSPMVAQMFLGKPVAGYVLMLDLNESYEVNGNLVEKMTLYVPTEEDEESVIRAAFEQAELIQKEVKTGI